MYTSAKVRTVSMPQPPAGVVGANSWLAAPPAAAYDTGLYCRPQQGSLRHKDLGLVAIRNKVAVDTGFTACQRCQK